MSKAPCIPLFVLLAGLLLLLARATHAGKPQGEPAHSSEQASPMAVPPLAGYRIDPDTGLKVWRLGGSASEMQQQTPYPDGQEAITLLHAQHFYSRTSPTNRSETYALGSAGQHQPYAALWRLADKRLVGWVPSASPEAHLQQRQLLWDKQADNVYWFTAGNRLLRASIDFARYQTRTEVWDTFPAFAYITFGFGEGNFADDGKRLVIAGAARDGSGIYLQPYEVANRNQLPWRKVADTEAAFDWASVDPTGEYIVTAQHAPTEAMQVIPFMQAATAQPRTLLADVKHSDMLLDPQGKAWLVYGNWRGLFAVRLADGHSQRVWPVRDDGQAADAPASYSASGHVARIAGKPGWVLLSRHQDGGLYQVDISGQQPARYVGNTRQGRGPRQASTKDNARRWGVTRDGEVTFYKREARAAASATGRYLFFVSDYHAHPRYDPEPEPGTAFINMIELQEP